MNEGTSVWLEHECETRIYVDDDKCLRISQPYHQGTGEAIRLTKRQMGLLIAAAKDLGFL